MELQDTSKYLFLPNIGRFFATAQSGKAIRVFFRQLQIVRTK